MNVLGVVAEFNPIHNGHQYLLKTARQQCGADYTIVVMSGNFTQRGEPAIYDKFIRTRLALACGADLVIEMPVAAATASARDFARTGIALLAASGVVTHLAFGCENASLPLLQKLSDILLKEPDAYKTALKEALKNGASWPAARSHALTYFLKNHPEGWTSFFQKADALDKQASSPAAERATAANGADERPLAAFLKQPNNILAMEYLMALKTLDIPGISRITPLPVQRIYSGYHDRTLDTPVCSATALRRAIFHNVPGSDYLCQFPKEIRGDMAHILDTVTPMEADDFSQALLYRLMTLSNIRDRTTANGTMSRSWPDFLDMDRDLCCRIENQKNAFTSFDSFCDQLCSRTYTRTRLSRVLIHILLGITAKHQQALQRQSYAPYLRVLGFRQTAAPLLGKIKTQAITPLLTRTAADARRLKALPSSGYALSKELAPPTSETDAALLFSLDLLASDIYRAGQNTKTKTAAPHEFQQKIIIY